MANKPEYVAAIDIGTTKIVALMGRRTASGKLDVIGIGKAPSRGVKRGVVLNIEETAMAIQEAVNSAQEKSGAIFTDVYVGIAGQHIRSIRNRGYKNILGEDPEITQNDVDDLHKDMFNIPIGAGEEIIHVIAQNYKVDNEMGVKNPVGMSGKRLEATFHIVIGQIASMKNVKKSVERVNLHVKGLILEPLASSESVLTLDEKEAGVALIDIGGGTTDIAIFHDGIICHTAVIPFGGNVITKDIKEGCSILHRFAESLKVQYGSALADIAQEDKVVTIPGISGRDSKEISFKSLSSIIQARTEEIFDAVMYEIENSGYADSLGAGIALTGGGSLLKHLPQLVKFRSGLDVRVGFPAEHIMGGTNHEINRPMYSTSVGLLIKGLEMNSSVKLPEPALDKVEPIVVVSPPTDITPDETKTIKPKDSFMSSLRNTLSEIFEEKDTNM
jgi:cell division protein FtsA